MNGVKRRHRPTWTRSPGLALVAILALAFGTGSAGLHARETGSSRPAAAAPPKDGLRNLPLPVVDYARGLAADLHTERGDVRRIDLYRDGDGGKIVAVTLGIPFPPGMLFDARTIHIRDARGTAIPARVEPTLYWHFANGGIRAVRVQFRVAMSGDHERLQFGLGAPVRDSIHGWPYVDGLVMGPDGIRVPGVLATLTPEWMSASLIAGPQLPAVPRRAYDRYFATQFDWAHALPVKRGAAWLFDRPTTLFQQYVRTGRKDYLKAAVESYRFYMKHIKRTGAPGWSTCGGGFDFGKVNPCDSKYVYIEPILLALGLTGDASEYDTELIGRMVGAWDTGGWNIPAGPYLRPDQRFTEREAGLGLLAVVSAWELTGNRDYLEDIHRRLGWLYQHQTHNPDGLGEDGSWRNSWQKHEGDKYDPATDVRGTSPWMSENIIDGLWHAWLATGDKRIPVMITAFGGYLEDHAWIAPDQMPDRTDWRSRCSGPDGQISWYWSSAHATHGQLVAIQNSEGWYSDAHDVELTLPVAAALYFEADPARRKALHKRLELLETSYNLACAAIKSTPRRFNWNNRGVGVVQWFIHQFETGATGAPLPAPGRK